MGRMLSSVAGNGVNGTVVSGEWNIESNDRVASFNECIHIWIHICMLRSSGQELSYLIQKSSFTGYIGAKVSFIDKLLQSFHLPKHKGIFSFEAIL